MMNTSMYWVLIETTTTLGSKQTLFTTTSATTKEGKKGKEKKEAKSMKLPVIV